MPRKQRPLDRDDSIVRDASLIVIASEDTYAVDHYFQRFHTTRVRVRVLPTMGGCSAPTAVIARLDEYAKEYEIGLGDELWVCIDCDRWPPSVLNKVIAECHQKSYRIAISIPCFELWIYLHFGDAPATTGITCADMTNRLTAHMPGYNKQAISRVQLTLAQVEQAIARARMLPNPKLLKRGVAATGLHEVMASLQKREPSLRLRQ
ncbi:MAG: RloB domain-containing protein [Planctomycetes bacterium]|nr:RloB domain-containing protein [Planctomycetota bacterium]